MENVQDNRQRVVKIHIALMLFYIMIIYIPFLLSLYENFGRDVLGRFAVSNIGWIRGHMGMLYLFILLTFPFSFYQFYVFNRFCLHNLSCINIAAFVGAVSMAGGALIPLTPNPHGDVIFLNIVHLIFSIGGTIVFMSTALYTFLCAAGRFKYAKSFKLFFITYHAAVLIAFAIMGTAAAFQLSVTFLQFLMFTAMIFLCSKKMQTLNGC